MARAGICGGADGCPVHKRTQIISARRSSSDIELVGRTHLVKRAWRAGAIYMREKMSIPSMVSHSRANDTAVIRATLTALMVRSLVPVALQAQQPLREQAGD